MPSKWFLLSTFPLREKSCKWQISPSPYMIGDVLISIIGETITHRGCKLALPGPHTACNMSCLLQNVLKFLVSNVWKLGGFHVKIMLKSNFLKNLVTLTHISEYQLLTLRWGKNLSSSHPGFQPYTILSYFCFSKNMSFIVCENHTEEISCFLLSILINLATGKLIFCCLVIKSCLTFSEPWDYSPPGSSVHEISQARILEWVAIRFSRGSSQHMDQTYIFCTARWILYHLTT